MIIWINGAFGSGKSTVALELNKRISGSFVFDPEVTGAFLWHVFPAELSRKGDFQDIPMWREFNYQILKYLNDNYNGTLIVPMTINNRQYYHEIIQRLKDNSITLCHFILYAEKETIVERLKKRGDTADCWAAQQAEKCINAYNTFITETKIYTDKMTVDEIVSVVLKKCDLYLNPWYEIKTEDYDNHMGHPNVAQIQMLSNIMKEQMETISENKREESSIAILGITNGNGLNHVEELNIGKIIGIDINDDFLNVCGERYKNLGEKLALHQIDLITEKTKAVNLIRESELILANLLIEHIHLDNFIDIIEQLPNQNRIVSCVIQHNPDGALVSSSGFEHAFDKLIPIIEEADEQSIVNGMANIGYNLSFRKVYTLPNGKRFIRVDFISKGIGE